MDKSFVSRLLDYFKDMYGLKSGSAEELFESQRNLLEYVVYPGRELENKMFEEAGKGYEGATVEKEAWRRKEESTSSSATVAILFPDCSARFVISVPATR